MLLGATLTTGCNPLFGIHEGTPRPTCSDILRIHDLEDGDESICPTNGRTGGWYDFGDGTPGGLAPKSGTTFTPTRIEDGSRGSSRYAARLAGCGFTKFGAIMGFNLLFPPKAYDASGLGGRSAHASRCRSCWSSRHTPRPQRWQQPSSGEGRESSRESASGPAGVRRSGEAPTGQVMGSPLVCRYTGWPFTTFTHSNVHHQSGFPLPDFTPP